MSASPVILALTPDLITSARVEGGVKRLGGQLRVVETEEAFLKQLALILSRSASRAIASHAWSRQSPKCLILSIIGAAAFSVPVWWKRQLRPFR